MRTFSNIITTIIFTFLVTFTTQVQAQKFSSTSQFGGTYYGKLDGRNAKIKFEYLAYNQAFAEWTVTLTDLDRNVVMTGYAVEPRLAHGGDHIINNVTLQTADKRTQKKFAKMMLHTWNTTYMTAFTDKGYGSVFAKGNANQLVAPDSPRVVRFQNITQFYGNYTGHSDGRNAKLKIERTPAGKVAYTLVDLDRNVTFKAQLNSLPIDDARPHAMRSVTLRSTDGRHTKTIGGLYLHTWNTNYISGYTVWSGKEYGSYFVRQAEDVPVFEVIENPKYKIPSTTSPKINKDIKTRTNRNFRIKNK